MSVNIIFLRSVNGLESSFNVNWLLSFINQSSFNLVTLQAQLHEAILWFWIFSEDHFNEWETALWVTSIAVNFASSLSVGVVVDQQLRVLEWQHFWLGKTEDCFDKLLNHCLLFHVEDLGTLAERLKNAISTVISHSENILSQSFGFNRSDSGRVVQLLVNDTLNVPVNLSAIPSLYHRFCLV